MKSLADRIHKFSGPPGTGKSTTLLNVVDSLITEGVSPENIVFTTFTRAGAHEAARRAGQRFNLPPDRLPWFRTLHSICYSLLERKPVMTWADWTAIAKHIGLQFSIKTDWSEEGLVPRGQTKGDYLLSLWCYARATCSTLRETYDARESLFLGHPEVSFEEVEHFVETVQSYKDTQGKMDHTDTLELYLANGPYVGAEAVIIDEAQDLSLLQWRVVEKICHGATKIYVAGDDDQSIHAWNGASPEAFIDLAAAHYVVLPQSHRIPSTVHTLAEQVIHRVHRRLPKEYKPREDKGQVVRIDDLSQLPLKTGSWLMIARNKMFLQDYVGECVSQGFLFHGQVSNIPPGALQAIHAWTQLQQNKAISKEQAVELYKFMSIRNRVTYGFKKRMEEAPSAQYDWQALSTNFGLVAPKAMPWPQALDMITPLVSDYLQKAQSNGGLDEKPRIEIGTIHSVKGKEADFVVIRPEMATRTFQSFEASPDAEHRVWYVGITRAKYGLFILNSGSSTAYDL